MTRVRKPRTALFGALGTDDIEIVRTDLESARAKQHRAYPYGSPARALYDETCGLLDDLLEAWNAAFTRETGAVQAARIRRAVHMDRILAAERLLAAERAA